MKNKEEILREEYEKVFNSPKYDVSVNKRTNQLYIFPAMDEYAEQAAINFMEWAYDNHWESYDSSERWINQERGNKLVTTKELFKIYKAANP